MTGCTVGKAVFTDEMECHHTDALRHGVSSLGLFDIISYHEFGIPRCGVDGLRVIAPNAQ